MVRPCFLVIDREFFGSISTRKLIIETAKFNVITAYSAPEAVETLKRFPHVNGIVLDAGGRGMSCTDLVASLRAVSPECPIVVVDAPNAPPCEGVDHHLGSFDPARLLDLLRTLQPEDSQAISSHEADLRREQ